MGGIYYDIINVFRQCTRIIDVSCSAAVDFLPLYAFCTHLVPGTLGILHDKAVVFVIKHKEGMQSRTFLKFQDSFGARVEN